MNSGPVEVLREIMRLWPKTNEEGADFRYRMNNLITDDVNANDFASRPVGEFGSFSEPLIVGDVAKIFLYDTGYIGLQGNLALMIRGADGQWRLKAFLELCLVCFGYQLVADNVPCDYCGATGWGEWEIWQERFKNSW